MGKRYCLKGGKIALCSESYAKTLEGGTLERWIDKRGERR